jgi:phosphopantetheinyl transferase (holo-ACP synthase)
MKKAGLDKIVLSISHSRDYAVAVAIGEERK